MKKKLIAILLILLSLCLIAAAVKIGDTNHSISGSGSVGGVDSGGSEEDGEIEEDGGSDDLCWIDEDLPSYVDQNIFAYDNVLSLAEGQDCEITLNDGSLFDGGSAILHADGSIDIPSTLSSLEPGCYTFSISLGEYSLMENCVYHCYYSTDLEGPYYYGVVNGQEDSSGQVHEISFGISDGKFEVEGLNTFRIIPGTGEDDPSDPTLIVTVRNGYDGTTPNIVPGRYYLRIIAVLD